MSNSFENQFISDTYTSILHTGLSALSSSQLRDVHDGIGQKSSLSLGLSGGGAEITGKLTAGNIEYPEVSDVITLIDFIFPVGSIYLSLDDNNPQDRFPNTTWELVSEGKFLVGTGTGNDGTTDKTFESGENLNGEYETTLTEDQLPSHSHQINTRFVSTADDNAATSGYLGTSPRFLVDINTINPSLEILNTGNGQAHNNTPPNYGVYIWNRTS